MEPVDGFAAQTVGAAVIQVATSWGLPVSTTHVISGSVMGAGATRRLSVVRWVVLTASSGRRSSLFPPRLPSRPSQPASVEGGLLTIALAILVLGATAFTLLARRTRRERSTTDVGIASLDNPNAVGEKKRTEA
jgi:hypothetical protein